MKNKLEILKTWTHRHHNHMLHKHENGNHVVTCLTLRGEEKFSIKEKINLWVTSTYIIFTALLCQTNLSDVQTNLWTRREEIFCRNYKRTKWPSWRREVRKRRSGGVDYLYCHFLIDLQHAIVFTCLWDKKKKKSETTHRTLIIWKSWDWTFVKPDTLKVRRKLKQIRRLLASNV